MSVQLLDKTRKINKLLHNNLSKKVIFEDLCKVMSKVLCSNVMIISRKGKILGSCVKENIKVIEKHFPNEPDKFINDDMNERFLSVLSTKENVNLATIGVEESIAKQYAATIAPVNIAGDRLGTIFIYRNNEQYSIDDIILAEYATTVVGLEMTRSESEETLDEERKLKIVRASLKTLSYTEIICFRSVIEELGPTGQGIIITSKIADEKGYTRSVLINAIKKIASAGIIEERSAGMKGTNIKIVNEFLVPELNKM